eukprot:s981_g18.t1
MWLSHGRVDWRRLVKLLLAYRVLRRLPQLVRRYWPRRPIAWDGSPPFLGWSATALAAAIRKGELTSTAVVKAYIQRIRKVDVHLNALVAERFSAALAQAETVDQQIEASQGDPVKPWPPFLGAPIILKEALEYPGFPYTNGLLCRKGRVGESSGPVVRRIEAAGFIVLGTGNVSEACMWMETYNLVYGRSHNPYGLHLTPGGSSGGTAALVAALGAPVGLTADIGGSTRIPALFNGLFGHKPTGGICPNTRTHLNEFHGAVCRICQLGMVCRHADDMLPLLKIMSGLPDGTEDPLVREYRSPPSWGLPKLGHLRVGSLRFRGGWPGSAQELLLSGISAPQREAQAAAVSALRQEGCEIEEIFLEDLAVGEWFGCWSTRIQAAGGAAFREVLCQKGPLFGLGELLRYAVGRSPFTFPALMLAFLEDWVQLVEPPLEKRLRISAEVEAQLREALTRCQVLLMPTLPRHGCLHDELTVRVFDSCFTGIWNALEFPATAVPMGLSAGKPVGVQIVSLPGKDELTLSVASLLANTGVARCIPPGASLDPR